LGSLFLLTPEAAADFASHNLVEMSSFPVGLQIGVETTTVVGALARAAMRMGGLAASDALRRSGSDPDTEEQLLEILGRNRLDPNLSTHFRSLTARSAQQAISHFLTGLVLESGAGPTVTRALTSDEPGRLSAVVQLSFLAWFHDVEWLAQAFTRAIEEELAESKAAPNTIRGLRYDALFGAIRACQQQTAAFSWQHHYTAVEHKINAELQSTLASSGRPGERGRTSGTGQSGPAHSPPLCISERGLPYVVLRALVRSFEAVQRFPEEHVLQITCGEGVSSIVVWCYYILGISVLVLVDGKHIPFGDEPYRVTVVRDHHSVWSGSASAVFLKPVEDIPIFKLVSSDLDPYLQGEPRAHARGFLKTLMNMDGISDDEMLQLSRWLVAESSAHFHSSLSSTSYPIHQAGARSPRVPAPPPGVGEITQLVSMNHIIQGEIRPAIAFLFDRDPEELRILSYTVDAALRRRVDVSWPFVLCLIYAFARVKDRDHCGLLPLSLMRSDRSGTIECPPLTAGDTFDGPVPNPVMCFSLLCAMLLGGRYTKEYTAKAFLVSDRGWSIFFPSLEATDPEDFDCGAIYIKPGVPVRDGVRKARIVDCMTDFGPTIRGMITLGRSVNRIAIWPGVSSAKLVGTFIGYDGLDAFAAMQNYDWGYTPVGR
jgi:hypothetical protein